MYNHRARPCTDKTGHKNPSYDCYECSTYKLSVRKTQAVCSSHYIGTKPLRELILFTIKTVSQYAITNEKDFIARVREASKIQQDNTAKEMKRKLAKDKKRFEELNSLYKKLYESYALGKIPEEKFDMLSAGYEKEQNELKDQIATAETELAQFEKDNVNIDNFMELAKRYTDFSELTTPMINEFVEKIIVHSAVRADRERTQEVEIYLNFVGNVKVPQPEPTPEEIEQAKIDKYWKDKYWRTKDKELARRKRQKAKLDAERLQIEKSQKQAEIDRHRKEIKEIGAENLPVIPAKISNAATP